MQTERSGQPITLIAPAGVVAFACLVLGVAAMAIAWRQGLLNEERLATELALRRIGQAQRILQTAPASSPAVRSATIELEAISMGVSLAAAPGCGAAAAATRTGLDRSLSVRDVEVACGALSDALWTRLQRLGLRAERQGVAVGGLSAGSLALAALAVGFAVVARRRGLASEALGDRLQAALSDAWEARREAQQASRAKSEFLATISHEIRTPMTAILGNVELLSTMSLTAQQRDLLTVVEAGGQALMTLLGEVLDLSAIEAGRLVFTQQDTELLPLMDEVVLVFADSAHERRLQLFATVGPAMPAVVRCDGPRVRQLLVNLVGNAVKFTESGEVWLHGDGTPGGVEFRVTDTGPGIDPATQALIWEPFRQGDTTSTRRHGGSGLGLAIARKLARELGGDVELERSDSRGSVFLLHLPTEPGPAPAVGGAPVHVDVPGALGERLQEQLRVWGRLTDETRDRLLLDEGAGGRRSELVLRRGLRDARMTVPLRPHALRELLGGLRQSASQPLPTVRLQVLVVDDTATNREVVGRLLERLDCTVTLAAGAVEAIQAARLRRFDLIFMDYDMPDIDGLEATRVLRREGLCQEAVVLGLSGHVTPQARSEGLEAGMDDFLGKPVRLATLELALRRWRNGREAGADWSGGLA